MTTNDPKNPTNWDAAAFSSADPFTTGPNLKESTMSDKMFNDIVTRDEKPTILDRANHNTSPSRPAWQRPFVALGGVAAAIMLVVVATTTIGVQPSAAKELSEAVQQTAAADSGKVSVEVTLDELSGSEVTAEEVAEIIGTTGNATFTYDGDDYQLVASIEGEEFSPQARFVDDQLYVTPDGTQWELVTENIEELIDQIALVGPAVKNFDGAALEQLVKLTDDISKSESDGVITYSGTVKTADVVALETKKLPAGLVPLKMLEKEGAELPETITAEMTVVDGSVTSITTTLASTGDEQIKASGSITTRYSEVGEPQTITAPTTDQVVSE